MPEIAALEEGEAERWNRAGRLAAWLLPWIPEFVAYGVAAGIKVAFSKDGPEVPDLPSYEKLIESLPDYLRDDDGEG